MSEPQETIDDKKANELSRRELQAEQRRIQSALMKEKIKEMRRLKMQQQQEASSEADVVIIANAPNTDIGGSLSTPDQSNCINNDDTTKHKDASPPDLVSTRNEIGDNAVCLQQNKDDFTSLTFPRSIHSSVTGPSNTLNIVSEIPTAQSIGKSTPDRIDNCEYECDSLANGQHADEVAVPVSQENNENAWRQTNMNDSLELPQESNATNEMNLETQRLLREKEEEIVKMTSMKEEIILCLRYYETELTSHLAERDESQRRHQQTLALIMEERDQAMQELESVHRTFYDLHRRHELTKTALENYRQNEDKLKECLQLHLNHQKQIEIKYQALRKHAEAKLQNAKAEIDNLRKSYDNEIERLKVLLKREEVQVKSLETQLQQKNNENIELTKICEELLGKR